MRDRLSEGLAAVHVIAVKYVAVMRCMWGSERSFDFDGEVCTNREAFAMVRPAGGAMPLDWGGTSDLALDLCGKVADVYALGGDTFTGAGEPAAKAHAAAQRDGRSATFWRASRR